MVIVTELVNQNWLISNGALWLVELDWHLNPILGGVRHVRWLGGWVNLPTPVFSWSICPNITKLGSYVVHLTRIKKIYVSFWFSWWRHHISSMTSSKSVILKVNRKISVTFLIFVRKSWLTPQMKDNKLLFQKKLHSLTNFVSIGKYSR